jgi:hypothetical protein
MKIHTHTSAWRSTLALLPGIGVVLVVLAVVQGNPELALTSYVYMVLAPLAAIGWVAAWSMGRVANRAVVTIAQAPEGDVALQGIARPFPGQPLLTAADGSPCLWCEFATIDPKNVSFKQHAHFEADDSSAPFMLVDDSGQCMVLPAGADINGEHKSDTIDGKGSYIADGDRLHIAGQFKAPSMEVIQQVQGAFESAAHDMRRFVFKADTKEELDRAIAAAAPAMETPLSAVLSTIAIPSLPLICTPKFGAYAITAMDGDSNGSFYGLLKIVNVVVLVGSLAMIAWLLQRVAASV